VKPDAGAAWVPNISLILRPPDGIEITNVLIVAEKGGKLLLSSNTTPAPGNGPVVNSAWGLYAAPFVSVRL
jgi:hypothetical protein